MGREGSVRNRKEGKGRALAASPSGSLSLFGVRGANRGELRDHLTPKEGRVDWQLARNGDFPRLEARGQNWEKSSKVANVIWRQMNPI